MALRLHSLARPGCLLSPPPPMLQYKAKQSFLYTCMRYSPFISLETLRHSINCNTSGRLTDPAITSRLPTMFTSSGFYSTGLLGGLNFLVSRAGYYSGVSLKANSLNSSRSSSSISKRELYSIAKGSHNLYGHRREDEHVLLYVLHGSKRRWSSLPACHSSDEELPASTSNHRDGGANANKVATRKKGTAGNNSKCSVGVNEKKGAIKKKSKTAQPGEALSKKNEKPSGNQEAPHKSTSKKEELPASTSNCRDGGANANNVATRKKGTTESNSKCSVDLKEKKGATEQKSKPAQPDEALSKKDEKPSGNQEAPCTSTSKKEKVSGSSRKSQKAKRSSAAVVSQMNNSTTASHTRYYEGKQLRPLYPPKAKSVVVVESVTKAKVIQKYLGNMFEVLPSYGHVRDLAARSRSVRPDEDFSMVWEVPSAAWTHIKSIRVALSGAENLILASDPDREGEAIAWHIIEMLHQQDALNENVTVARVMFHEITEKAIKSALNSPRYIDMDLVNAYLARRALDYLIGFSISPVLWRKLPGCPSAGRVQSAALALICDRESEIEDFKPQEYWSVDVDFEHRRSDTSKNIHLHSHITHYDSKNLNQLSICSQEDALAIERRVFSSQFEVIKVKRNKVHKKPPMPYITSSLQQDAANKLHFTAAHTMKVAQKLYEGIKLSDEEATGLITYMRTDGLHISDEAAEDIRSLVKERYGEEYAPKNIRKYFRKVKNAQEAHEAIRPTSIRRLPSTLVELLDDDSLKLYTLIWTRTMASQMESATNNMVQVDIGNAERGMIFRSVGSGVDFQGYLAVQKDIESRAFGNSNEEDTLHPDIYDALCRLKVKDSLSLARVTLGQHHTKPPPRYSEGALVKKLEELGIGRPSTYASIMKVLQGRNYVTTKSRVFHPEIRGRMVSAFLSHHFSEVADYSFTADMENELDNVSAGQTEWKGLLKDYWERFSKYCELASKCDIRQVATMLEEKFSAILFSDLPNNSRVCPSCAEGTLRFKLSRFGAGYFIGCDQYPTCKYKVEECDEESETDSSKIEKSFPPKFLGLLPNSNEKIFLKNGPFGYYLQIGEDGKRYSPKRRMPLSEVKDVESVTLEDAIELLRYPKTLGNHPDDNRPVMLCHSQKGFNIKHRRSTALINKNTDPKKITLEVALEILSGPNVIRKGRVVGQARVESLVCE